MSGETFDDRISGLRAQLREADAGGPGVGFAAPPRAYGRLMAGAAAMGAMSIVFGWVLPAVYGSEPSTPGAASLGSAATKAAIGDEWVRSQAAPAAVAPAAVAAAPVAPAPVAAAGNAACPITLPGAWLTTFGKALGPVPPEVAAPSVARAEVAMHGKVSPEYQDKPREFVSVQTRSGQITVFAVIPPGMTVPTGSMVQVAGRHRDLSKPCNYVPFLLTGAVLPKG